MDLSWIVAPRITVGFDGNGLAKLERVNGLIWQFGQTDVQNSRFACSVLLLAAPSCLRHQASEQPNLRQMRPRIEVIGRQDLELDKAGCGRRQLAFLVSGFEQKPVRQLALADRTERSIRPL